MVKYASIQQMLIQSRSSITFGNPVCLLTAKMPSVEQVIASFPTIPVACTYRNAIYLEG